ncbi:glycosyltransferase [Roseibium sp. MMSF_3544]|uniref:glycosyltransferase n=1 Tax=unclassified Roseibium TaxID=2629323 RepID=UPI00273DE13E|nr:glycosyltransferase [Roseibium sp. MMSF_3544]
MARSSAVRLDLCVLADIRRGDVAAPSHAATLEALAGAGYRIGLLAVAPDAIKADPYTIDPSYSRLIEGGQVKRLAPGASVECALALGFDARLFSEVSETAVNIRSDHRIVTLERPLAFASLGHEQRERMNDFAAETLGGSVAWAPTTSRCRDALSFSVPHWLVTNDDWRPTVPAFTPKPSTVIERARPVVGIASIARTRPGPWPVTVGEGARAFGGPNIMWRLRGAPDAERPNWPQAAPIEIWPDDKISLTEFLANLDILANADQAIDDPCPVEVLYALRAGVVPFLEPRYRPVFAGAAIYGRPSEIAPRAIEFQDNRGLAADLRDNAGDLIASAFSPQAAVSRVRDLIGKPREDSYAPAVHIAPPARALFFSTNGVGLGHLTRQLAIARRLPKRITPVFLSHSQAVDIVHDFGYAAEYLPYHAAYGERRDHWNAALVGALTAAIAFYRPKALIFDGNVPFVGLMKALEASPGVARVWIRRALWGPNRDLDALDRGDMFDLVVEPGESAWARDDGPTVERRHQALTVPPVTLLDGQELLEREAACAELGLDPGHVNILVALGSGNNIDTSVMTARALAHLHGRSGVGTAVAQWRIAGNKGELPAGVARLTEYPFGKFLRAFDFAVAAAGYNTFAEHLREGLPTVWVPNEHAEQDRQILRARFAEGRGLGALVRHAADFNLAAAIDKLLDPNVRAAMRAAHSNIDKDVAGNGAGAAAEAIASLCDTVLARDTTQPSLVFR